MKIRGLTQSELQECEKMADHLAREQLGEAPVYGKHYRKRSLSEYPPSANLTLYSAMALLFFGGFLISLFRVYSAAHTHYLAAVGDETQAWMAGLAVFMMGEIAIIIAMFAREIIGKGRRSFRLIGNAMTAFGGMVAVMGNIIVEKPQLLPDPLLSLLGWNAGRPAFGAPEYVDLWGWTWTWVLTLLPTTLVLLTSYVGEQAILENLRVYHAAKTTWQQDRERWQAAYSTPRDQDTWSALRNAAIWEKFYAVNTRGRDAPEKRAYLDGLDEEGRIAIIVAERLKLNTYDAVDKVVDAVQREEPPAANFTTPARVAGEQPMLSPQPAMGFRREHPTKSEEK